MALEYPPTMSQGNISFVEDISRFAAFASYQLIRIQVFYVYFNAAISKFKIIEWLNGTAIYYYWLTNPYMGANDFIQPIIRPLVTSRIFTPLLTWGAIVFELILAFAFVLQPKSRQPLLIFAVSFHLVIAVVHGLIPFCLAMTGALILYLRPLDNQFNFNIVSRPFLNIRANQ